MLIHDAAISTLAICVHAHPIRKPFHTFRDELKHSHEWPKNEPDILYRLI